MNGMTYMKVFISGSKTISALNPDTISMLQKICSKGSEILIGDCFGADYHVQKYLFKNGYKNVTVYASEGKVRHNEGNFPIKVVNVENDISGFEYYRCKDIAMATDADCALMLWDGKTKGTLCNIKDMKVQNKPFRVIMYRLR